MRPHCNWSGPHQARSAAPSFNRGTGPYTQRRSRRWPSSTKSWCATRGAKRRRRRALSVAGNNRVTAGTVELVAHAAKNRPHRHVDVVIGEVRESTVRAHGAEHIEVSFNTEDPVAAEQQLATQADGPANLGVGCLEGLRPDRALEPVVN